MVGFAIALPTLRLLKPDLVEKVRGSIRYLETT